MHLSEHTYIVCSLIHGVITLSHRGFISLIETSQRSSRTSLRFDRKGALRGELTKMESQYTSHPVMDLVDHHVRPFLSEPTHAYTLTVWIDNAYCSLMKSLSAQILTGHTQHRAFALGPQSLLPPRGVVWDLQLAVAKWRD